MGQNLYHYKAYSDQQGLEESTSHSGRLEEKKETTCDSVVLELTCTMSNFDKKKYIYSDIYVY